MTTNKHSRPIFVGALASIFAVPLIMTTLMAFSSTSIMIPPLVVFLVGIFITLPTTCVAAVPLALLLRRIGRLNAIYMCLAGAILGALALGIYTLYSTYYPEMRDHAFARSSAIQSALQALVPGALYGFLSASAFCIGAGIKIRSGAKPKRVA